MSDGLLIQTMQGILARLDQIDDIKDEIKEEYAQAKAAGYDKTALGVAIREIRGRDKAQTLAAEERAAIVELYVSTFDNSPRTYVHVPAREAGASPNPRREHAPATQEETHVDRSASAQPDSAEGRPAIPSMPGDAGTGQGSQTDTTGQPSGAGTGSAVRAGAPVEQADEGLQSELTADALRARLDYDPETGVFTWTNPPAMALRIEVGDRAGRVQNFGYRTIRIGGKDYVEHRLAWLYLFDEWPKSEIDHVNGDKADNRLANLRLATASQNMANREAPITNKSGFKGVSWVSSRQRWSAFIHIGGHGKFLGYFDDREEASRAYEAAAEAAHGEFAVHNRKVGEDEEAAAVPAFMRKTHDQTIGEQA